MSWRSDGDQCGAQSQFLTFRVLPQSHPAHLFLIVITLPTYLKEYPLGAIIETISGPKLFQPKTHQVCASSKLCKFIFNRNIKACIHCSHRRLVFKTIVMVMRTHNGEDSWVKMMKYCGRDQDTGGWWGYRWSGEKWHQMGSSAFIRSKTGLFTHYVT